MGTKGFQSIWAFAVMDGCGHRLQFQDPQTFNRIHLNFLQGKPVPEGTTV